MAGYPRGDDGDPWRWHGAGDEAKLLRELSGHVDQKRQTSHFILELPRSHLHDNVVVQHLPLWNKPGRRVVEKCCDTKE